MSRIVSIWLRAWPIARLLRSQEHALPERRPTPAQAWSHCDTQADPDLVDRARPLVLASPGKGGPRITALNRAAHRNGITSGELLSNARAKALDLQVREADPAADAAALARLAVWALRYSPTVAVYDAASGADGLFLEITGCAHLFGGEEAMLQDIRRRLTASGLAPRLGIADTAGAAWAVSHYAPDGTIVASGCEGEALRDLPLAALRLPLEALSLLKRLGLRRIGEIMHEARAPFAARFEADLLQRLDQALARAPEPLAPVEPPPRYHAHANFVEPIFSTEHVLVAAGKLLAEVSHTMLADGAGARLVRLLLFPVAKRARQEEGIVHLDIGLASPSRDPAHIAQLIALRLERLGEGALDTDFGFEAAALHVRVAEPLSETQGALKLADRQRDPFAVTGLVDRLRQRLGSEAVRTLIPHQSHLPELAERRVTPAPGLAEEASQAWGADMPVGPRPPLLLSQPETAEALALIPDGPPRQFRWRGVLYHVVEAQGPERIAPEWWRRTGEPTRDYYLVEDGKGLRFWIYRAGLYTDEAERPAWYVHGVFA
ncbi:MAG: DNA polymerase Y family protein [Hyphomicrobiales bacterium]|nr:MAG: DNA polymerase Y family protein [Hyphomicrobiales bacterium]